MRLAGGALGVGCARVWWPLLVACGFGQQCFSASHKQGIWRDAGGQYSGLKLIVYCRRCCVLRRPLSLLILGRPGVGKTTLLRDIARLLSLTPQQGGLGRKVIICDTSNEICGGWQL